MKHIGIFSILFFLILGGVLLARIKSITTPAALETTYIKATYSLPVTLDPIKMNDSASLIFSELTYEGLLRFTPDYNVQPAIAESWETSRDGLTLTFKINPKAKFHNGQQVKASDVVASLSRNLGSDSLVFKYYDMIKGAKDYFNKKSSTVRGLKAKSDLVVEVELEKPFPPILYVLAGGSAKVLPHQLIGKADFWKHPVGSGPFKIKKIKKTEIVFERFEDYYGELPKIKNFILRELDQKLAMSEAMKGNVHDISSWPLNGREEVFTKGKDVNAVVADTWVIGINTRTPPFNSLKVRKFFQQSIDAEKFRTNFYPDAKPAYGYIPQGFPGHVEDKIEIPSIEGKPPKNKIVLTIPKGFENEKDMSAFFINQLRAKGWNIEVESLVWDEMMKRYSNKSMQSFLVSMIVDYPDAEFLLNNFESTNPDNFSGIKDNEVDNLIVASRKTNDRITRQALHKKLATRINNLSLTVNLFHSRAHYWVHKCVDGFRHNLLAVAYTDYRKVSFNQSCLKGGGEWAKL